MSSKEKTKRLGRLKKAWSKINSCELWREVIREVIPLTKANQRIRRLSARRR